MVCCTTNMHSTKQSRCWRNWREGIFHHQLFPGWQRCYDPTRGGLPCCFKWVEKFRKCWQKCSFVLCSCKNRESWKKQCSGQAEKLRHQWVLWWHQILPQAFVFTLGAVVAQLASARPSEREVPGSIFSDFNVCFDFPLVRVAIALNTRKTEHWQWQGG